MNLPTFVGIDKSPDRIMHRRKSLLLYVTLFVIAAMWFSDAETSRRVAVVMPKRSAVAPVAPRAASRVLIAVERPADEAAASGAAEVIVLREVGEGEASYYGAGFAGRSTANGEVFDPSKLTAAHPSLPFNTRLRVTNLHNGRQVVVRVNDRGPFTESRIVDVSAAAARELKMLRQGLADVRVEIVE